MPKNHEYIIADHIRTICFIINEGVMPSGKQRGYILRRLMRRLLSASMALKIDITRQVFFEDLVRSVSIPYIGVYDLVSTEDQAIEILYLESLKYQKAIQTGQKAWAKILNT